MGREVKPQGLYEPTIYEEVANTEAYWRGQRDRWRTATFVAIFLLVVAILAVAC